MKQLLILMSAVALLIVGCKKAEVIERDAQTQRDGYSVVAKIKGNTLYRVNDTYIVYILINDEDSSKVSISR